MSRIAAKAFWASLFAASVVFLAFCADSLRQTPGDVEWWLIAAMFSKLAIDSGVELVPVKKLRRQDV